MKIKLVFILLGFFLITEATYPGGFLFEDITSTLRIKNGATLSVKTTLSNDTGSIIREASGSIIGAASNSKINFSTGLLGINTTSVNMTGDYLISSSIINMNGSKSFDSTLGTFPLTIRVSGTDNLLEGSPLLSAPLNMFDPSTTLSLGVLSPFNQNITLNGGTLYLKNSFSLASGVVITGTGTIIPNTNLLILGSLDAAWTSSVVFQGTSDIRLNARVDLSGIWTFSGYANLKGSGNLLDLTLGGTLFIRSNSTLNLSDIGIEGLGKGFIVFEDTTSKLNVQNTSLSLSTDYTVTTGGIYVDGSMTLIAASHQLLFDQLGSLTVDGGTVWYDTLGFTDSSNIRPTVPDGKNLTFLRSGLIRNTQSAVTPAQLNPSDNYVATSNTVLDESKVLQFQPSGSGVQLFTYDGSSHEVQFSRTDTPMLIAGPDTRVMFTNIVFKGFSPDYLEFQSEVNTTTGVITFGNNTTLQLAFACDLDTTLTFSGSTTFDGNGQILSLGHSGAIVLCPSTSLTLRNLTLKGLADNKLRCMSNTSTIVLENVTLVHDSDYSFTVGCFNVNNNLALVGASVFSYQSTIPSIILNNSILMVDRGMTLSYSPGSANRRLLTFEDETAQLLFNGATLSSSSTGVMLTKGTLIFKGANILANSGANYAEAIKLGNGLSDANDLTIEILPGASVDISSGYVDI